MTKGQRKHAFEWMTRELTRKYGWIDDICDTGYVQLFLQRYNPNNQYLVYTNYNGKDEVHEAFEYNGNYHLTSSRSINHEYITKIEKHG